MLVKIIIGFLLLTTFAHSGERTARIGSASLEATVHFRLPLALKIQEVLPLVREAGKHTLGLDLLVLPEYLFRGPAYGDDVLDAENHTVLDSLKAAAVANRINIIFQIVEKEGTAYYNTVFVVDRKGEVVGKYRKVNLPPEEHWATPGSDYAVFDLDFGRVGVLICWDFWFTDPARILADMGAELIVVPTWCNILQNLETNSAQTALPMVFSVLRNTTCTTGGQQDVSSSVYDATGHPVYRNHVVGKNTVAVGEVPLGALRNLARHKKTSTSENTLEGFPGSNAVDGIFSLERDKGPESQTAWKAEGDSGWLEIDLQTAHAPRRISLAVVDGGAYTYIVEGSNDRVNYTRLGDRLIRYETFLEHGIAGSEIYSTLIDTSGKRYRYIRVTVKPETVTTMEINEIMVFGN